MNRILLCIVIALSFLSCKKDKLKGDKEILIGNWKWVYSIKSERSHCDNPTQYTTLNPSSEGVEYSMEFKKKGYVIFKKNEAENEKFRIVFEEFTISNLQYSGYFRALINLNNKEDNLFVIYVKGDTLIETGNKFPFIGHNESCLSYTNYFIRE